LFRPFSYIIIALLLLVLVSCSNPLVSKRELPKKIKYNKIVFVDCNPDESEQYLCLREQDAIKSVMDLKKCQEQNTLLRQLLNGS
jgi:hypothetical protein